MVTTMSCAASQLATDRHPLVWSLRGMSSFVYFAKRTGELSPTLFRISAIHCEERVGGTTMSVQRDGIMPAGTGRGGRPSVETTRLTSSSVFPSPISSQRRPPCISGGACKRISPSCGE